MGTMKEIEVLHWMCVILNLKSPFLYSFNFSGAGGFTSKCHIRWTLAILRTYRDQISFFFLHSSQMRLLNTRCSSMLTSRRLKSSVLLMTCALHVNKAWSLSFWELIISNWISSGLTIRQLSLYQVKVYMLLIIKGPWSSFQLLGLQRV